MRRFVLIALLLAACKPRFPINPPDIREPPSHPPPAIRLWSFYPAIPAHDPGTGEQTGRYVPAHGLVESTRPLGTVVVRAWWQGRPFSAPVTFDKAPWGTFVFPTIKDPDGSPKFTISFEENGRPLRWSFVTGSPPPPVSRTTDTVADRLVNGAPPPPLSPFHDDEMVYDARNTPPLAPRDASSATATLYRVKSLSKDSRGYRILGSRILGTAAAQRIADILNDPAAYSSELCTCRNPEYAVSLARGNETFNYVVLSLRCGFLQSTPHVDRSLSLAGVVRLRHVIDTTPSSN